MNDPCILDEIEHEGETYYKVKEIPVPSRGQHCTMCVAEDGMGNSPDAEDENGELCRSLPQCRGGLDLKQPAAIFIRPEDLEKYKVAYTIARIG